MTEQLQVEGVRPIIIYCGVAVEEITFVRSYHWDLEESNEITRSVDARK